MARGRRLPEALTEDELGRLFEAVTSTESFTGLRNRTMLQVMAGAGLRVSELCGLLGRDVDLGRGEIRVNDGKGGKDRVVPVAGETRAWLRAYCDRRTLLGLNGRHPLFVGLRTRESDDPDGYQALQPRYVQQLVGTLAQAAGIERRVTPHTLRHTYATQMLRQGIDVRYVQTLLGHEHLSTTEIYTHVTDEDLRRAVQGDDQGEVEAEQGQGIEEIAGEALAAWMGTLSVEQLRGMAAALEAEAARREGRV